MQWLPLLAAFAGGAVAATLALQFVPLARPAAPDGTLLALLSDHARAVVASQTIEVPSGSTHTVKPWLAARLGYSPAVPDLAAQGFVLQGGRRGWLGGQPVAVMVYGFREHEIDVYALRGGSPNPIDERLARDGFELRGWTRGEFHYVAISDLGAERFAGFVTALRDAQAATGS